MNYIKTYEEIDLYKIKQKVKGKLGIQNKKELFLSKFLYSNPNIKRYDMYRYNVLLRMDINSKFVRYISVNVSFSNDQVNTYTTIGLNEEEKVINYLLMLDSNVLKSEDYGCKEDYFLSYEHFGMGELGFRLTLNDYPNIGILDYNYDLNDYINSIVKIDYDKLLSKIKISDKDSSSELSKKDISKYVNDVIDFFIEMEEYGKLSYKYTTNKDELGIKLSYRLNRTTGFKDLLDDETFEIYKILSTAKKRLKSIGDLISFNHEIFQASEENIIRNLININIKIKIK